MCCLSFRLPGIAYLSLLFLIQLFTSTEEVRLRSLEALNPTTQVIRRETPTLPPPYLNLPVFVESKLPLVEKEHFFPARSTVPEFLPERVREILLPARRSSAMPRKGSAVSVSTSCKRNIMRVQVQRSVLGAVETYSQLKLGTCHVSKTTRHHLYFEYDLGLCGTRHTIIDNQVTYSNTLRYNPAKLQAPIRRAVPFTLPIRCYFNRYQYSYKIGYTPEMRMLKVFKPMKNTAQFNLSPRNAQWERVSPSDKYVLGKPMYFEAEAPFISQDERLYVLSCYATPDKFHTSTPHFPVVINFGCMVESKDGRSRFIPYKNNAVRFSVDAFLFKGMTDRQLYMHCIMSVGSSVPSSTFKSCNYDTNAGRWTELYGSDSVCACCDSSCSSDASSGGRCTTGVQNLHSVPRKCVSHQRGFTVTKIISSRPWTVKPKGKSSTTSRRKTFSTTTISSTAPQPEMIGEEVNDFKMTSQPPATAESQKGKGELELEWPFGNGGVSWVVVEDEERRVMGTTVVEEKEVEMVTEPPRIFENIFGFDK